MKVILLTNDAPKARCLEALLIENKVNLQKVIVVKRKQRLHTKGKFSSAIKTVYHKLSKLILAWTRTSRTLRIEKRCMDACNKKLEELIERLCAEITIVKDVDKIEVSDVNGKQVETVLQNVKPDVCVVWGTPILRSRILALCPLFVNAHTSLLPQYKGTFSEFWQSYDDDRKSIGVTFHLVDKGVDTGAIIKQIPQKVKGPLEPYWLRLNNTRLILENYPKIINSLAVGGLKSQAQTFAESSSKQAFKSADRTVEKRLELYSRLKSKHIDIIDFIEKQS